MNPIGENNEARGCICYLCHLFSNDARKVYFSHILSCSIINNLMFFLRKSGTLLFDVH